MFTGSHTTGESVRQRLRESRAVPAVKKRRAGLSEFQKNRPPATPNPRRLSFVRLPGGWLLSVNRFANRFSTPALLHDNFKLLAHLAGNGRILFRASGQIG